MFWDSQRVLVAKLMFVTTSLVPEFVLWNSVIPTQQPAAWLLATQPQSSSPRGHSTCSAGAGGFVPVCHCGPAWQLWWDPSVGPEVSLQSANQLIASEDFTSSTLVSEVWLMLSFVFLPSHPALPAESDFYLKHISFSERLVFHLVEVLCKNMHAEHLRSRELGLEQLYSFLRQTLFSQLQGIIVSVRGQKKI